MNGRYGVTTTKAKHSKNAGASIRSAGSKRGTLRAVTYCRISADDELKGLGVGRQHTDTRAIADREGCTVVAELVDNNRSASKRARKAREQFAEMMTMVERGEVDVIITWKLDRFSRDPYELELLIRAAEDGIKIYTAHGHIDLSTRPGVMMARMLTMIAADEAEGISERATDKLRHDAMSGRPHWPRRPFGYTLSGEIVAAEADKLREIVQWIIDDGVSATEAARRLNEQGVAQASGKPWQSAGVKFLVTNVRNAGLREYHGEVVGPGTWPAIITEDEHRQVVAALAVRSQGARSGRRSLLTGMVCCGVCGETMTRTNVGSRAEFRCTKRADTGKGCGQSINAVAVEQFVTDMVMVRIGDVRAAKLRPAGDVSDGADGIRAQLAELAGMVGTDAMTMGEWKAMREPLIARLEVAEIAEANQDVGGAFARLVGETATLAERWDDLDIDLRRRIISTILWHVTIGASGGRGRLDLARVTPAWKQ
jgi:site-specific DNA recombinase